jgi:hypothetical protein
MSSEIVELVRRSIPLPVDKEAFDSHLAGARDDGEMYQQAFQWLGIRRDPGFRDRVIQLATLRACRTDDLSDVLTPEGEVDARLLLAKSGTLELELDRWTLPAGQAALGRILNGLPSDMRGPVLTTNFDPLTEIAVRRSGGTPTSFVNADDTSFLANLRVQSNPFVLHLHGYWRDSTTLSTPEQLELRRPTLEASLRHVLERYTVIVLGYSGWSDVIARIIRDQVAYQATESLDILWAFFEDADTVSRLAETHPVISALAAAPGRVQPYASVDANVFLPKLERALADYLEFADGDRPITVHATLTGWTSVTSTMLASYEPFATKPSAVTFLDGRSPSWQDAVSHYVARRELANTLLNTLKRTIPLRESSVDLVLGASGEGKSTIALQVAALAAADPDISADVLLLEGDYFGSEDAVLQLPKDRSHVLVVDDAYRFVTRIQEVLVRVHREARGRIHLILLSRDTDWYNNGGAGLALSAYVRTRTHSLRGLTRADAFSMVLTWERIGAEALGRVS